jgi:hypothetical protein
MATRKTRKVEKTRTIQKRQYDSASGEYVMVNVPEVYYETETYTDYSSNDSTSSSYDTGGYSGSDY